MPECKDRGGFWRSVNHTHQAMHKIAVGGFHAVWGSCSCRMRLPCLDAVDERWHEEERAVQTTRGNTFDPIITANLFSFTANVQTSDHCRNGEPVSASDSEVRRVRRCTQPRAPRSRTRTYRTAHMYAHPARTHRRVGGSEWPSRTAHTRHGGVRWVGGCMTSGPLRLSAF